MRKYLEKRENGVYYIAEGYNEDKMKAAGFSNVVAGISAGRKMIRAMEDNLHESIYAIKWEDSYAVYAVCAKQDTKRLEGRSSKVIRVKKGTPEKKLMAASPPGPYDRFCRWASPGS